MQMFSKILVGHFEKCQMQEMQFSNNPFGIKKNDRNRFFENNYYFNAIFKF